MIRFLSSDGATVINQDGKVVYCGCVIDMVSVNIKGVKGTGESASGVFVSNGISIKISQDGTIKLFKTKNKKPIIF